MIYTANYIYYNGELYHASDKKSQHKYIKKVKVNGKWRYYYKDKDTGSKYGTYTDKKGLNSYTVKKSDKLFSSKETIKKDKVYKNRNVESKDVVYSEGRLTRSIDRAVTKLDKFIKKNSNKKFINKSLAKGAKVVSKLLGGNKKNEETKIDKTHKYIQRIKAASGKYIYFYTQDQYDRYLNKQKYQKKEPGFMKKVPEIESVMSSEDDMREINEKYDPYRISRSQNCAYCTAAYELRSRGYDVQAATNDGSSYLALGADYLTKLYEDPDTIFLNEKGKRDKSRKARKYDGTNKQKETKYNMKTVANSILEYSGKNTRGEFRVTWEQGGSHSMIYEVDKKGKITIRDAQTNTVHDLSEFQSGSYSVSRIAITRTDNLKLKKGILKTVENNKSEARDYYVEDGHVYKESWGGIWN